MAMKLPGTGSQGSNNVSLFYEQVEAIVGALFNPKSYILVLVLNVHRNIYVYIWSTLLSQQCFFPIYILHAIYHSIYELVLHIGGIIDKLVAMNVYSSSVKKTQ